MRYQVPVIALHCSGAGASEWYSLAEALGDDYELLAPEHYGSASNGAWTGEHAFTLADDAARAIALIDADIRSANPCPLSRVKRTFSRSVAMSAFDPKRTC